MNKIEKRLLKGVKFQYKALFILMLLALTVLDKKYLITLRPPKKAQTIMLPSMGKDHTGLRLMIFHF